MKIMWALAAFVSIIICIREMIEILQAYQDYDTVASFGLFNEIPSPFPAITICNLNPFQTDFALQFLSNFSVLENLKNDGNDDFTIRVLLLNIISQLDDSDKKRLAFDIDEILLSCVFNSKPCLKSDFDWYFHPYSGTCYRFNSQLPAKNSTQAGYPFGLKLELFVGNELTMPLFIQKAGYQIMIGNQTRLPSLDEGFFASSGRETAFEITRSFSSKLPQPYSRCSNEANDSEFRDVFLKSNEIYSREKCLIFCLQKSIIENCKCFSPSFNSLKYEIPCLDPAQLFCTYNKSTDFLLNVSRETCSSKCPSECNTQTYNTVISSSLYPILSYAKKLMNNSKISSKFLNDSLSLENVKKSVLAINIYYKNLKTFY